MLDAISDFWKPSKKNQAQEKLNPQELQIGSSIGFGFVPQTSLSGRRVQVSSINTYQFGTETLTSFVLSQEGEAGVSMIVAESDGEQYLAISRRIAANDRPKIFESRDIDNVMDQPDATQLSSKEVTPDFKGWLVGSYKRQLHGLTGKLYAGDYRKNPLPASAQAQDFKYTLLVSDSNEHAIEIEKYNDGRIEVYATVYRRRSDIGEVLPPSAAQLGRPDIKLASASTEAAKTSTPFKAAPAVEEKPAAKSEPIKLQELAKPEAAKPEPAKPAEAPKPAAPAMKAAPIIEPKKEEKPRMEATAMNGASAEAKKPTYPQAAAAAPAFKANQEVKAVSKLSNANGMDNENIECELRVANKIIDEAIRQEMRLSDVVRRIIELPVAHQEAVHIPITLSDEDYALLAIRYSISSSDRESIKRRIIEDLNDFSGSQKKAA